MAGFLEGKNIAITGGRGYRQGDRLGGGRRRQHRGRRLWRLDGRQRPVERGRRRRGRRDPRGRGSARRRRRSDISQFDVGEAVVAAACDNWGTIDGVVCPAGVLRERMLFNMSEDEWDHVVAVHLKGHFNVYRAAFARMRKTGDRRFARRVHLGRLHGFDGAAELLGGEGGIVSLTRSAAMTAASIRMRGGPAINANCIAPVAKTRMSENVPFEIETGSPKTSRPWRST
ncbi:MAG: SDR family oxidoreductase [Acidimicrobiales bacterium]